MVRSVLFGAAAIALTVTAAPAAEAVSSANSIMPGCRGFASRVDQNSLNDAFDQGFCAGTVGAIGFMGTAMKIGLQSNTEPDDRFAVVARRSACLDIPAGVTLGQEVRVVISYIEVRPARMHEPFRGLALDALRTAWPCK